MRKLLRTERLEIRPFAAADLPSLKALLTDVAVRKTFIIPDFETPQALDAAAEQLRAVSVSGEYIMRGIYRENRLIGLINEVEASGGSIELGYALLPAFQGQGYATEALRAVLAALPEDGYTEAVAGAFVDNPASLRVMQKCGMQRIAREEDIPYRGVNRHCVYCAVRL